MKSIGSILGFIGRHGTEGFALALLMGLALPQFAERARPLLPITIFCFMTITFLRADMKVISGLIARPKKLILSALWLVLAPALLTGGIIHGFGREALDPGLVLGLAILGAAPPIMSAPAVAILYGFEPSLIIASVLGVTVLSPVLAPLMVDLLAGQAVPLDQSALMLRMLIFVGGGFAIAMALRRWVGKERVAANKAELDGFGVVMYFLFAIAAMDGVADAAMARPGMVATFLALAMVVSLSGLVLSMATLRFALPEERLILGYGAGQRNMGLLVAALGAGVPKTTFLFFALAQAPIYLMPWILKGLARRISARKSAEAASHSGAPSRQAVLLPETPKDIPR